MTMETRKEIAAEKKRCGSHNCTQAVLCTYHDFTGMDEETIKNAGNAFAAGMGNMEGTCGALVGAGIVLGLATQDKAKSIKGMRMIMDKFKQRNGATQCKLLKGVGTGKVLRECPLCVADASEFLEEILEKEGSISETFFLTLDSQSGNHYIIQFYRIVAELRLLYFFTIYRTFLFNSLAAILCNLTIHASCSTA